MKIRKRTKPSPNKRARPARRKPKVPANPKLLNDYYAEVLRARREELGLTPEQVFAASGISPVHLEYIEAGNPFPLDALERLQPVLRVRALAVMRKVSPRWRRQRARLLRLGWVERILTGNAASLPLDWYERDPWKLRMSPPAKRRAVV